MAESERDRRGADYRRAKTTLFWFAICAYEFRDGSRWITRVPSSQYKEPANLPQLAPTSSKLKWFFTGKQKKNLALEAAAAIENVTESLTNSVVIDRASKLKLELAKPKASTEISSFMLPDFS